MILFDVGDKLKIVPMLSKSVKGSSAKVLKLSLMALRPCYQFSPLGELQPEKVVRVSVRPSTHFPDNRSKDFLDFWHKASHW